MNVYNVKMFIFQGSNIHDARVVLGAGLFT